MFNHRTIFFLILLYCIFTFVYNIFDGIPTTEKIKKILPDSQLQKQIGKIITDERNEFEKIWADIHYHPENYEYFTLKKSATYEIIDSSNKKIITNISVIRNIKKILYGSLYKDETKTINALKKIKPAELNFNYSWFFYGGIYIYPTAAFLKITQLLGAFKISDAEYYLQNANDLRNLFVFGKLFVFLNLIIALYFIYKFGELYKDKATGILLTAFFATAPFVLELSKIMKPYCTGLLFLAISLYYRLKWYKTDFKKNYYISTISARLSVGANYLFFIIPYSLIVYDFFQFKIFENRNFKFFANITLKTIIISIISFLVVNPYFITSFDKAVIELQRGGVVINHTPLMTILYFKRFIYMLGIPGAVLLFFALLSQLKTVKLELLKLIFIFLPFYILFLWKFGLEVPTHYDGFPILIFFALPLSIFLSNLLKTKTKFAGLIIFLIFLYNLIIQFYILNLIKSRDAKLFELGEYINNNIPAAANITPSVVFFDNPKDFEQTKNVAEVFYLPFFDIFRLNYNSSPILINKEIQINLLPDYIIHSKVYNISKSTETILNQYYYCIKEIKLINPTLQALAFISSHIEIDDYYIYKKKE